ncbi:MAG: hypothetical protein E7289_05935 [Lachnospiraceae bacterium]|nr:hypothetical protein [Lachnospiraceae bacterium]
MIIRLSVEDNDFQEVLERYLSKFYLNIDKVDELTTENAMDSWKLYKKINGMLNPNCHYKLTKEDEVFLEKQIRDSFSFWCKNNYPKDEEYLSKNLTIKFLKSMTDKWENGEACYWFQHSGCVITQ